jgi:streptogramin lyase
MRSLALWTVAFALAGAPTAQAGEIFQAPLGSTLSHLVVGADGGAWVFIDRPGTTEAIGRAHADGSFRTAATRAFDVAGALGPDGSAWYYVNRAKLLRSDANGALSTVNATEADDLEDPAFATGADGTLWTPLRGHKGFWHIAADGSASQALGGLPKACRYGVSYVRMARASDGAMWLADHVCQRLVRVSAAGTTTVPLAGEPADLAPDASGGVWVIGEPGADLLAHVDATGKPADARLPDDVFSPRDVAVAPDGSAWFAFATCRLIRITSAGEVSTVPAPVPAAELGFDPAGAMWLTSAARIVRVAPGESVPGACDDRVPKIRLRRVRGDLAFAATVREPAELVVSANYFDDSDGTMTIGSDRVRRLRAARGGTVRYPVPPRQRRRFRRDLAAGRKPYLELTAVATDLEGNLASERLLVDVRRRR